MMDIIPNEINTEGLPSISEIVKLLSRPMARRHLEKRKQGGKEIYYVAWYQYIKYLDLYAKGWMYEIIKIESVAGQLIMCVRLSIPCAEGIISREATGIADEGEEGYGDTASNAEAKALKRACAKFGLGLYLYDESSTLHPANKNFSATAYDLAVKGQTPETPKMPSEQPKQQQQVTTKLNVPPTNETLLARLLSLGTKHDEVEQRICAMVSRGKKTYDELSETEQQNAINLIIERNTKK